MTRSWIVAVVSIAALGCQRGREPAAEPQPEGVEVVDAPAVGDVAEWVRGEVGKARASHRRPLVYVSAAWCEPCRYFEEAVDSGALDAQLPDLRLLKFDSDRDDSRLIEAGYGSSMIPLFVAPLADGRGSERRFAGAIKGPGAIDVIVPRVRALLAAP